MQSIIWKPIVGFENRYLINNTGEVISLSSKSNRKGLKSPKMSRHGYWIIQLYVGKKPYTTSIHRLLAQAFIPNPNDKRCVNHINGIKTDNRLDNLEWTTDQENVQHAISLGLR